MTREVKIVDAHAHVFMRASAEFPRDSSELFPPKREAPADALLAVMKANRVSNAVLVALTAHDEYLKQCLIAYPGKFAGVLLYDPTDPNPVDSLRRRLAETGALGLRLYGLGKTRGPKADDFELIQVFKAALADGIRLSLYLPPSDFERLETLMAAMPELTIVLNHLALPLEAMSVDGLGRPMVRCPLPPPTMNTVLRLATFPNVFVLFSGHFGFSTQAFPYNDLTSVVQSLYEAFGTRRMMWASDWPWMAEDPGYARVLSLVDHFLPRLSPQETAEIMGLTAGRLFGLETSGSTTR